MNTGSITKCPWANGRVEVAKKVGDTDFFTDRKTITQALEALVKNPDNISFFAGYEKQYTYAIIEKIASSLIAYLQDHWGVFEIQPQVIGAKIFDDKEEFVEYVSQKFSKDIDDYLVNVGEEEQMLIKSYNIIKQEGERKAMPEMYDIKSALVVGLKPLTTMFYSSFYEGRNTEKYTLPPQAPKRAVMGLHYSKIDAMALILVHRADVVYNGQEDEGIRIIEEHVKKILGVLKDEQLLYDLENINDTVNMIIQSVTDSNPLLPRNIDRASVAKDSVYDVSKEEHIRRGKLSEVILGQLMQAYKDKRISEEVVFGRTSGEHPNEKIHGCPVIPYFKEYWGLIFHYLSQKNR